MYNWKIETNGTRLATCSVNLPNWCQEKNSVTIEINNLSYDDYYTSRIWIFNRGILVLQNSDKVKNIDIAIQITEERLKEMFAWSQK